MAFGNAARATDEWYDVNETQGSIAGLVAEQAAYTPRFRVVQRRSPAPARRRALHPVQRALLLGAFPALLLLVYVLCWTLAMRGGYTKNALQAKIRETLIVQAELRAEKRRLQSPGPILERAVRELGMVPAGERHFVRVGASRAGLEAPGTNAAP